MTDQYIAEDINIGPDPANFTSVTLDVTDQQGSDGNNDTVFFFTPVVSSSAAHFTVTSTAALGTAITILQPGVYMASLTADVAGGNATSIAISVGGAVNTFGTTPAAIGGTNAIIAISSSLAADASVVQVSTIFRIAPASINGTLNVLRFLGTANAVWTTTTVRARIDRLTAI